MKQLRWVLSVFVIMILFVTGCSSPPSPLQVANDKKKEDAGNLMARQPGPTITYSIERENIINRLRVTNDPKQVGWIYLFAGDGSVTVRFPVRGKVTSGGKRLTSTQMFVRCDSGGQYTKDCPTEAPDEMGAYGSSNPYIFWFTPSGMLEQWAGLYLYTSEPYKLDRINKVIEYVVDASEMANVVKYKAQIEATPMDQAKGGQ